jgi:hypothetical protein
MNVDLRHFARDQLPMVETWFENPETQRWLVGRDWPLMALELADPPLGEFRGARETERHRFLAWDKEVPVGYVDCGTFDRWATWDGGPGEREWSAPSTNHRAACPMSLTRPDGEWAMRST